MVNYYTLLGVPRTASPADVREAYRRLSKLCHPDVCGVDGNDLCALLNDAYSVLRDENARAFYDAELAQAEADVEEGFDPNKTRSKWCGPEGEARAVFVDENTCIGCKQCVWAAPAMFRMETLYGRSQVWGQWLNSLEQIETAIDACPVQCIHWVARDQLPVLEHVMAKLPRTNVGIMAAGQGGAVADVFAASVTFVKQRQQKAERREKLRRERLEAEAASAAEAAANGGASSRRRVETRDVQGMLSRWQRATGWLWDPSELLNPERSRIPAARALVPVTVRDGPGRRVVQESTLQAAEHLMGGGDSR